jgi:hypothetical protein
MSVWETIKDISLGEIRNLLVIVGAIFFAIGLSGGITYNNWFPMPDVYSRVISSVAGAVLIVRGAWNSLKAPSDLPHNASDSNARDADLTASESRYLPGQRPLTLAPLDTFKFLEAIAVPEPANRELKWKRKLRVTLRNTSGKEIKVQAPDWMSRTGYVPFQLQPRFYSRVQAAKIGAGGWLSDKWDDDEEENQPLILAPNAVFRASVGLDPSFSIDEIDRRHKTRRVGMLIVPVTIDGHDMEYPVKL